MVTIYEVKTGKPVNMQYMIDAKESVANGFYTFTPPTKEEDKPAKKVVKKVEPVEKVEEPVKEKPKKVAPKRVFKPKK